MYDVIVIGGGPAGLTAGIYAARAKLKTLLIEKMIPGGQTATTDWIENYPGFDGISGMELAQKMEQQARKFGVEIVMDEVKDIKDDGERKLVVGGKEYVAKAVIIATGAREKKLGIPGENELKGRGVSYCATCDGAFFSQKKIAVIGGGDSAITEALFLTKFAEKVYVIHRRNELRAEKILQERAMANEKIEVVWDSVPTEIIGENRVEGIKIKNVKSGEEKKLEVSGVFIYVGMIPNTDFIECKKDEKGYIITDENMETSCKGVFAAGDCRSKDLRQITTAVGDGAIAAISAEKYISS